MNYASVDQEVGRALGERRADPQAGAPSLGVVDQPSTLAAQAAVDPPASVAEPGFVAKSYSKRLDACRAEAARAKEAIEALQARYVGDTGVKSLRIRANSVVGHHDEVPASSAQALGPGFTLRQGLASSTRFTKPELDSLAAALEDASA